MSRKVLWSVLFALLLLYIGTVLLLLYVRLPPGLTTLVAAIVGPTLFVLTPFHSWGTFICILALVAFVGALGIRGRDAGPIAAALVALVWFGSGLFAFVAVQ